MTEKLTGLSLRRGDESWPHSARSETIAMLPRLISDMSNLILALSNKAQL